MSVGAATARCSSWAFGGLLAVRSELGCHFRLGNGGGAQVQAQAQASAEVQKCSWTQQVCRSTLHFTSLQSPSPGGSARFPFSHFQGLRSFHFWRWAVDPACSKTFTFHQLKLPDVGLSTRQAVILRLTIALSGSIGSTSPASWRSPASRASKLWMRKARKSRKQWRSGPAAVGEWAVGSGQRERAERRVRVLESVLVRKKECMEEERARNEHERRFNSNK